MIGITEIEMIFGSQSDKDKIQPGIIRFSKEHPDIKIVGWYASADNVPEKVAELVAKYSNPDREPAAVISGAGMSNVLTGVIKTHMLHDDLNIGVPISDSVTRGLSSLLSTDEKPPLNPVLAVGMNNTYAAANIAYRFALGGQGRVVVLGNEGRGREQVKQESIDKLAKELAGLGIEYQVAGLDSVKKDDLVLTIYTTFNQIHPYNQVDDVLLMNVDQALRQGRGIQIAVREKEPIKRWDQYMESLEGTEATAVVSIGVYKNAAMVAAQIMRNEKALEIIKKEKNKKVRTFEENPGFYVQAGVVHNMGGK